MALDKQIPLRLKWPKIPLNQTGDPDFRSLADVRKVFTDDEITVIVNRQLYAANYQRETHKKTYVSKKAQMLERIVEASKPQTPPPTKQTKGEHDDAKG